MWSRDGEKLIKNSSDLDKTAYKLYVDTIKSSGRNFHYDFPCFIKYYYENEFKFYYDKVISDIRKEKLEKLEIYAKNYRVRH